jgi:hypothetical protein
LARYRDNYCIVANVISLHKLSQTDGDQFLPLGSGNTCSGQHLAMLDIVKADNLHNVTDSDKVQDL